jgi:uncharacterized protein (TIGR02246 family)
VNETQLQRVADELEIRNLMSRVAQMSDTGDLDEYQSIYTPDAVWGEWQGSNAGQGQPTARGIEQIVAGVVDRRAAGIQGPGSDTQHVVNTITVRFDGPDTAKVRAYWQYYGTVATQPKLLRVGTYDLVVKRTDDGWRFHERMLGNVGHPPPR